jgi:hypothetical protein
MSTTRPKQHHYVPRFYLERFADPEGHVWTFDKFTDKVFATSPSKAGPRERLLRGADVR